MTPGRRAGRPDTGRDTTMTDHQPTTPAITAKTGSPAAPAATGKTGHTGAPATLSFTARIRRIAADESGMSTVEYALGTVAAAAFGALLYTVVTGGQITDALTAIIDRALSTR